MKLYLLKGMLDDNNNKDIFNIKVTLISGTIKLSDWYCSVDRGEYGRTACPHICYPVDVFVTDKDGIPVKNAIITLLEEKTENRS